MNDIPNRPNRLSQQQQQSLQSFLQFNNRHLPPNHSLSDEEGTYPSPAPSPRPGLRLSLHLSHNKVDVTSHSPSTHYYIHQLPFSSATPRHSASSVSSSSSSSSSSPSVSASASTSTSTSTSSCSLVSSSILSQSNQNSAFPLPNNSSASLSSNNTTTIAPTSMAEPIVQHHQLAHQSLPPSTPFSHSHETQLVDMVAHSNSSPTKTSPIASSKQSSRYPLGYTPIFESYLRAQRPPSATYPSEMLNTSPNLTSSSPPTSADITTSDTPNPTVSVPINSIPTLDVKSIIQAFQSMDPNTQRSLLSEIVSNCTTSDLTYLNSIIAPKLKRDFLRDLPLELAHHILSFIDNPQSLARVAQVSRYWHQLIETEDWVWRAQCIRLFGPTSCSSLPSPKSHIAPPTSYLYTTGPTSLDAVSSTLKALSNSSNSSSSNLPGSHRLSLVPCTTSRPSSTNSSKRNSPTWPNAGFDTNSSPSSAAAPNSSSLASLPSPQGSSNVATSTVLSSMLLANQGSLGSSAVHGPSAVAPPFATLPSSTKLRSSMTSRLSVASAIASANATQTSSAPSLPSSSVSPASSTLTSSAPSSQGLGVTMTLPSLDGKSTSSKRSSLVPFGKSKVTESVHQSQDPISENQRHSYATSQYCRQATSYKSYFKRRFMIDRNWVSGHHTLISNTTPETGVVTSLQFDHHHIVVGCDNSRIQIFETTTGRLLRTLQGHLGGVWALEFIKGVGLTDEKILVSGGCDREVRVWDMNTGKCRQVMSGHTGTIRCLKIHQLGNNNRQNDANSNTDSNHNDDQNNDAVWNDSQRKHYQHQQENQQQSQHIAITGSRDATLRVWDIQSGKIIFVLQGHRDSVRCIEAHGDILVSGSYDCTARVWSLRTGECLLLLQGHFQQIYSIAFNGEYIVTGSLDSTCRLWSPVTGACLATLQGHTQLVGQLQLSGDSLMTGGGDGFMYMWNLKSMVCQYRVQAHEQSVTSLCFDSKRIVTGGNDGAVKLWDRQTGRFIRNLTKTDAAIWRVAICEERVVMCMQKNGRTATEIMCFDSEAPVLPHESLGPGLSYGPTIATVMPNQQKLWVNDGGRPI